MTYTHLIRSSTVLSLLQAGFQNVRCLSFSVALDVGSVSV